MNKFLYGGGGAETVMFRTADLLRASGHHVSFFAMSDPRNTPCPESKYFPPGQYYHTEQSTVQRARSAVAAVYSWRSRRALRDLLVAERPDIAHLHNVYHQLTSSVIDELVAQRVPIILTAHDYKPVCPSYLAYTDNAPCRRCVTGHPGHVIAHRCIKGSLAASTVAAAEAALTRTRHSYHRIDAFIAPSNHCRNVLTEGGLPADRIHVIPNFVADDQFRRSDQLTSSRAAMVVFVGRLEETKGIRTLLAAARIAGTVEVRVVGDGPLRSEVERAHRDGAIRYLGPLDWSAIAGLLDSAAALVLPALSEENCPMVVLEAGARGCPVVVSDRGGLPELVEHGIDGLLFAAGDANLLAEQLLKVVHDPGLVARLGCARRARTAAAHTADGYLQSLMDVYWRCSAQARSS